LRPSANSPRNQALQNQRHPFHSPTNPFQSSTHPLHFPTQALRASKLPLHHLLENPRTIGLFAVFAQNRLPHKRYIICQTPGGFTFAQSEVLEFSFCPQFSAVANASYATKRNHQTLNATQSFESTQFRGFSEPLLLPSHGRDLNFIICKRTFSDCARPAASTAWSDSEPESM
jgi:hypothetical protein